MIHGTIALQLEFSQIVFANPICGFWDFFGFPGLWSYTSNFSIMCICAAQGREREGEGGSGGVEGY
jgi:hypothetical protein